jgi:hypothetical protein
MKSKQLANVLIKILGLSICARALPGVVSAILSAFMALRTASVEVTFVRFLAPFVGVGVEAAVGILLIINSRKLAEFLLKGQED